MKQMKRFLLWALLVACSANSFSQNRLDSLRAFIDEFHVSAKVGYNFLLPGTLCFQRNHSWCHNQWAIFFSAGNNVVEWSMAMKRDYLKYGYLDTKEQYQADYLRLALTMQLYLLKRSRVQLLVGPSVELDWITRNTYSQEGVTLRNPDIGYTTGVNLLVPLTFTYSITECGGLYVQVAGGIHLRDDHEMPYMNHWGYGPGVEAALVSNCPFGIGAGYSIKLK